jgi:phosphoglycolate phosphatase
MKIQGIIFDLDGTLLDSIGVIADSLNQVLIDFKFPTHDVNTYKEMVGDGIESLIFKAMPKEYASADLVKKIIVQYRQIYSADWRSKTKPYYGIPELLFSLQQKKIPLAVISNKVEEYTQIMVKELLPKIDFQVVHGARPDIPLKPDPTAALAIAEKIKASPQQMMFIGDSDIDITTGHNAGMIPIGVLWGFRQAEELIQAKAAFLLKHPSDLLALID